ncbi:MAG: DUF2959 family protein [Candidatus Methylomirabilales bacterium]
MKLSKIVAVPLSFLMMTALAISGCATSGPKEAANLASQVEDSRRALQVTEEHIRTTMNTANSLGQAEGGNLASDFKRLNTELKQSNEKLAEFRKRVASMEKVSNTFFTGWTAELDKYETEEFRKHSEVRLQETRGGYDRVLTSMQQADEKFQPFFSKLHDLTLYLNHNLNAEGVAAIKTSVDSLNADAEHLYSLIGTAVQEADGFTVSME